MSDWRADPAWRLSAYEADAYPKASPPARPPRDAELAGSGAWASVFRDGRPVATWFRTLPISDADVAEMRKRGEEARERIAARD